MKRIGLIGGLSWHSSALYYQKLNEKYAREVGPYGSCPLLLWNMDFQQVIELQKRNDWHAVRDLIETAVIGLRAAGAEGFAICSNTMHRVLQEFAPPIPCLHIATAVHDHCRKRGHTRVGFLGTRLVMSDRSYFGALEGKKEKVSLSDPQDFSVLNSGIDLSSLGVLLPEREDRIVIDDIIFQELTKGICKEESRAKYQTVARKLVAQGAQCVVMGCTEIGLLLKEQDVSVPLVDSLEVHVDNILHWLLAR